MPTPPDATAILANAEAAFRRWRTAHPEATFAELEQALDVELQQARARLLADTTPLPETSPPSCPRCGTRMVWRGQHRRTLRTTGDVPLPVRRRYASCPACGHGLFPPGPDA